MVSAAGSLLEREHELEALAQRLRAAAAGAGAAVLVEADAGIGKTALLGAARQQATEADMSVLSARAGELEREFAWGVVRQLFDGTVARAAPAVRAELLQGAASLARPALGIEASLGPVDVSYAALHGLYWLTVNVAERRPMLLVVDDLHWADATSLRFIAHLLPRIAELPILLLIASRPVSSPAPQNRQCAELLARIAADPALFTLRPVALTQAASSALVRDQLTDAVNDDVCAACFELTGGNPFLLRTLVTELDDEDRRAAGITAERVRRMTPAGVSASVLPRLAMLPDGAVPLARAVAILGADAPFDAARRLAGLELDEAATCAAALIRSGVLAGDDPLRFVHPLVRSSVYGDLAKPESSRWHHRAALLLAGDGAAPDRIASHLAQSIPAGDPWTVDQLRRGAADAMARGAPDVAADYLRRALAEPAEGETHGHVLFELGHIEIVHDPALAAPDLRAALELVREPERRATVALALGEAMTHLGRLADAISVLNEGLAELDPDGPLELRSSLEAARLGAARWEPTAQPLRHQLVEQIRARAAAGERLDPRLHGQLAIEATAEGIDRDGAVRHARLALAAAELPATAATSAVPEAILVLAFADLAQHARDASERWLATARARAWPLAIVLGSTTSALAALYRGDVSDAVASASEGVVPNAEIRLAPITVAFLVEALAERGDFEAARAELATRGLDGPLPYAWATTPLLLARGRLHAAAGDHSAAVADLLHTGERAEAWGVRNPAMHPWRSSSAVSLAQLGDRERAIELAAEEVELARRWGAPRAIGVALRAAGIAHGGEQGIALLRDATKVLEASPAPLELARAVTDLGAALRRAGRRSEARAQLRRGLDLAHRLGGTVVAARARDELTIAGARPRRDALRGRDALTASELRVARLASDGHSNRDIAEALFVTLRTVEAHLTSSYGKLGISSRRELAAALGSSGAAPAGAAGAAGRSAEQV